MTTRSLLAAFVFVVAGCVASLQTGHAQSIYTVDIDGETVNLVVPEGYCPIDLNQQEYREWYDSMNLMLQPNGRMLLVFDSCAWHDTSVEVPAVSVPIDSYGVYFVFGGASGEFKEWPAPREWFVESVVEGGTTIGRDELEELLSEKARAAFGEPGADLDIREMHLTGYDLNAAYFFVLGTVSRGNRTDPGMGGAGMTVINSRIVGAMLSHATLDPTRIDELNRDVRALIRQLLDANPDSDN